VYSLRTYAVACVALGLLVGAFLIAIDPYDTGRLALFDGYGVPHFGQRLTAASLGREPAAEAAIIGNSTIQLIDPARLAALTGDRFVSLAIPGTGPLEQFAVADWYVRHHRGDAGKPVRVLVIGLDESWCRADGRIELSSPNPFPFWVYTRNTLSYVVNMLRMKSFEAVSRKINVMIGRELPLRADGYRDYDAGREWNAGIAAREFAVPFNAAGPSAATEFAAVADLRRLLGELPSTAAAVLVFLPRHFSSLPPPYSPADQLLTMCKAAYRDLAAERRHTVLIDFLVDGDIARNDRNFWDQMHYRQPVAELIEADIARALRGAIAGG